MRNINFYPLQSKKDLWEFRILGTILHTLQSILAGLVVSALSRLAGQLSPTLSVFLGIITFLTFFYIIVIRWVWIGTGIHCPEGKTIKDIGK